VGLHVTPFTLEPDPEVERIDSSAHFVNVECVERLLDENFVGPECSSFGAVCANPAANGINIARAMFEALLEYFMGSSGNRCPRYRSLLISALDIRSAWPVAEGFTP
jgi:hypothetical protein